MRQRPRGMQAPTSNLRGDLTNFRVAHYSCVDACEYRDLLQQRRVGAAAKEGRKWDFTTGCCARDPTAPSAMMASAAPI
jgi:hypothetical protein